MKKGRHPLSWMIFLLLGLLSITGCQQKNEAANSAQTAEEQLNTISTKDVQSALEKGDWVVVDTRMNDAFNGWPLDGISRGGHIKGAVDFSANWLTVDDKNKEEKLQQALQNKRITKDKNVILYDANGKDAKQVADYLKQKGFEKLSLYDAKEWAADESLPMESYPGYSMLVPALWVDQLIKEKNKGKPYKIFEVSWGEESKDYIQGHIPGAVHINTDEVEEGPLWNRLDDKRLEQFAEKNGITADTAVVLYGADSMPAFRVAAILKYMGVQDVRVLNGGYVSWKNGGFAVETQANPKTPASSFGVKVPANQNYIIDLPEAKSILADKKDSILVDIRSWDEYIGKTSGYDYIKAKGRPAGSVWGHAGTDNSNLNDFRNIDQTMRNASEILEMWKEWGITPDKKLAFYCGTGWRAAEVLIYADVMGLNQISLYDGGWNEWSSDSSNPVEQGDPRQK